LKAYLLGKGFTHGFSYATLVKQKKTCHGRYSMYQISPRIEVFAGFRRGSCMNLVFIETVNKTGDNLDDNIITTKIETPH
jgi:hypothetical protein